MCYSVAMSLIMSKNVFRNHLKLSRDNDGSHRLSGREFQTNSMNERPPYVDSFTGSWAELRLYRSRFRGLRDSLYLSHAKNLDWLIDWLIETI